MDLSMWMIADKLEKYSPQYDIKDGGAHITGVRFLSGDDPEDEKQYLCLSLGPNEPGEETALVNGGDTIILQSRDTNGILNDLMAIFDFYNGWESALWAASASGSFQRVLDVGGSVLRNPMMLSDTEGGVLAMSGDYRDKELNEFWVEARTTGYVPTAILASPMQKRGGEAVYSWTGGPTAYTMPDGTNIIGAAISVKDENAGAFALWEHEKPITSGDVQLARTLCRVFSSMMGVRRSGSALRSRAAILGDLIAGAEIDGELLRKLDLRCPAPWRLMVIESPYRSDVYYTRSLLRRLREHRESCVPLIHGDSLAALISEADVAALLDTTLGEQERRYFAVGLSLPFDDLRLVHVRYEQTCFSLSHSGSMPGVYYSEGSALEYLLSLLGEKSRRQGLFHPALAKLSKHDREKGSELYETLYQYLIHERAILPGAQALHIHRNSFMYRVQQIKDLTGLELDSPETRVWLLLSYLMEKVSGEA